MSWWLMSAIYLIIGLIIARPYTRVFYENRKKIIDQYTKDDKWSIKVDDASFEIKFVPLVLWGYALIWPFIALWTLSFYAVNPTPRRRKKSRLTDDQIREIEKEVEIGDLNEID